MKHKQSLFILIVCIFYLYACKSPVPKPRAYFRIDFPEKAYKRLDLAQCPYSFEYADIAFLEANEDFSSMNVVYEQYNTKLHLAYQKLTDNNFEVLTEDAYRLVYEHSDHADDITAIAYSDPQVKVYGYLYDLTGNVACPVQFVFSDSTQHWIRAALYIESIPNRDSLNPIIEYVRGDMIRMAESLKWRSDVD